MKAISILMMFAFVIQAAATEVDDTTSYYENLADSEAALNAMVQSQIDLARAQYFGCDLRFFGKNAAKFLTGNLFFGAIEAQVNESLVLDKRKTTNKDSIYRGTPYETSIVGRLAPLATVVNVAGYHVGSDKIGHFFDMGYELYVMRKEGQSIADLVARARWEQQGLWGMSTTGVKSYGDISANFDGYRLWQDMLGRSENPYFTCVEGSLKQIRAFRMSDYVSAAWTEAINCSAYSDGRYKVAMDKNIEELQSRDGHRYQCPVQPSACAPLRERYAQWLAPEELSVVISPGCN